MVFSVCNGAGCMDAPLCPTGATPDPTGAPLDPTGASLDPTGVRDRVWSALGRGLGLPRSRPGGKRVRQGLRQMLGLGARATATATATAKGMARARA